MTESTPLEITPTSMKARLDAGESIVVLDCRTSQERDLASLPGTIHTPLGDLARMLPELDIEEDTAIIVHCHHGMRSLHATQMLRAEGFALAQSLSGGIDRWSHEIDPSIPRY